MIDSYEQVISKLPFAVRRRARWAECDPAGVVFTGRYTDFLLGAVNLFYASLSRGHYSRWCAEMEVATPCRGLALDFRGALWPEDEFVMRVTVSEVRESSFDISVSATHDSRGAIFEARFSPICIGLSGERKRVPIPPQYREALRLHV